jgi:S-adenosylmethionine:tRNA ribosyltransferase-isomerase
VSDEGERTELYDYDLPPELVAQRPLEHRADSRLLVLSRRSGAVRHALFREIGSFLRSGDCLVLNDTRVFPARLVGHLPTGGRVELLLLRPVGESDWECLARPASKLRRGRVLRFGGEPWIEAEVLERLPEPGQLRVRLTSPGPLAEALEAVGHIPLPPYIQRPDDAADRVRYQTVYAEHRGSVAAPTAGLHFDEELLTDLASSGIRVARVTLHVGLGTFRPISAERVEDHTMHEERYHIADTSARLIEETRAAGGRVIAVGTTVVRTLETAARDDGRVRPGEGDTRLFIRPGHAFRAVDALVTNFHLPRSSLLVLVSAFAGREQVLAAYREAVAERYRFFSYGDAMLLL